jgi:CheY-like chemotaxis protein
MDVHMPEMDGLEATRSVISIWGPNRPFIAALTAGVLAENRNECIAAGVDDFLTKPMNMREVEAALERCYRSRIKRSDKDFSAQIQSLSSATSKEPAAVPDLP